MHNEDEDFWTLVSLIILLIIGIIGIAVCGR
jgi:hypothetical protein